MTVYHETATPIVTNPYAYTTIPPIGRLLEIICTDRSVGGCLRPGNRALANQLGYASASQIPYLLSQLASDGWIDYDPTSGVIMLLKRPESDQAIRSTDRSDEEIADEQQAGALVDSALIDPIDRDLELSDAENETDQIDRSNPQRMEDSCLTTTGDSESVAVKTQIPCVADSISSGDHPVLLLLAELGTAPGPGVLDRVLAVRAWTPQQIRDRWEFDQQRISASNGRLTEGIFWTALMAGQLAPPRRDPNAPLNPAAYAGDPSVLLGSQAPPGPDSPETIGDHARRILPKDASTADWVFIQSQLVRHVSDEQALAALAARRSAGRR